MAGFDDRFFPVIDIDDTVRYEYIQYDNKDFVFDSENEELTYIYKDDNGIWRKVDSVGISERNWNSPAMRNTYLKKYVDEIEKSENADDEELEMVESVKRPRNKLHLSSSCNKSRKSRKNNIEDENEDEDMLLPLIDDEDDSEILNELQCYPKIKVRNKRK